MAEIIFDFVTAQRIVFKSGSSSGLGDLASGFGRKAFLVTGRRSLAVSGHLERLSASLAKAGIETVVHHVPEEPDVECVDTAAETGRSESCDLVIGAGGGAVLDAAKAVAGLITNSGSAMDYLEVVGGGESLNQPAVPIIAVPTTAGTGTEATRNAVLTSRKHGIKASLRSRYLLPSVALVDPSLTVAMPAGLTASTGLDALTQLIESYVTRRANPLTSALAREGIKRVGRSLRTACGEGSNITAREDMAFAALMSGITLANAGLGAVHGIAGPLGGRTGVSHGVACARLLPSVLMVNYRVLEKRDHDNPARGLIVEAASTLMGRTFDSAEETIATASAWVEDFCDEMGVPRLHRSGLRKKELQSLADACLKASSMQGNPVPLTRDEVNGILEATLAG